MNRNVAIIFSDLKGYSKISDNRLIRKVEDLNMKIKETILNSDNHLFVNTWGDAFFICSYDCYDAASIALKMRDLVKATNWKKEGFQQNLQIRIGVHFANVELVEQNGEIINVIGKGISSGARIEPVVEPNNVWCSKIFYDNLMNSDFVNAKGCNIGEKELAKNFGKMNLVELRWDYEPDSTEPVHKYLKHEPPEITLRTSNDTEKKRIYGETILHDEDALIHCTLCGRKVKSKETFRCRTCGHSDICTEFCYDSIRRQCIECSSTDLLRGSEAVPEMKPDKLKLTFQLTAHDQHLEVRTTGLGGEGKAETTFPTQTMLNQLAECDPLNIPSATVETIGKTLYRCLMAGDVGKLASEILQEGIQSQQPVQFELRFDADQISLAQYPWEMIANDFGQFLVRDGLVDMTRYITYPQPLPAFDVGFQDLPLLRVVSQPSDLSPIHLIDLPLKSIETLHHATFEKLMDTLLMQRIKIWGIHFDGHGALLLRCHRCDAVNTLTAKNCRQCDASLANARQVAALAFEDRGEADWVSTEEIGSTLYNSKIQMALLLACETARVGNRLVFSGLAPGLVLAGVPAVVGLQYPVSNRFANGFSSRFYTALLKQHDVLDALRTARRLHVRGAWYSPVLYLRHKQTARAEESIKAVYHTRHIDTAVPSEVQVGVAFLVRLWIRRPETKPLTQKQLREELGVPKSEPESVPISTRKAKTDIKFEPVGFDSTERRKLRRGEVEVKLSSMHCDVIPENIKLFVDEHLDAPPAIFTVQARKVGRFPLLFSVWQESGQILSLTHDVSGINRTKSPETIIEKSYTVPVEDSVAELILVDKGKSTIEPIEQRLPTQKTLTVMHVIDMFKSLNLPVTDDGQQIEMKGEELRDFYFRMKNSNDPHKSVQAHVWNENLYALKEDRPALLDIVYKHFTQLADTTLEAVFSTGVTTLTQTLYAQLEGLALKQCQCDASLARKFVDEYLEEKGLSLDGEIGPPPPLVEQLTATSSVGAIELRWQLPTEDCDHVIVRRFEASKGRTFGGMGKEICQGKVSSYADRDIKAGQRYRYEIYSVFRNRKSQTGIPVEALAIGEVLHIEKRWAEDHIELRWELPGNDVSVLIFRRVNGSPKIQLDPQGRPEPVDPTTELLYEAAAISYEDRRHIEEGKTYHYRIFAQFSPNLFSRGVDVRVTVPKAPEAVPELTAVYTNDAGKDVVELSWKPARSQRAPIEYVLVRRGGSSPPHQVSEGTVIQTTSQLRCLDDQVKAGQRYTYAVFARSEGLYSHTGTAAPPVAILAEVLNPRAVWKDNSVLLTWELPAPKTSVLIFRRAGDSPKIRLSPAGPEPLDDSTIQIHTLSGATSCEDRNVIDGQRYHYRIIVNFGQNMFSKGSDLQVTVPRAPAAVAELTAAHKHDAGKNVVELRWEPVSLPGTTVEYIVVRREGRLPPTHIEDGDLIKTTPLAECLDEQVVPGSRYTYAVFVQSGNMYSRTGTAAPPVDILAEVTDLTSMTGDGTVEFRWNSPEHVSQVIVRRSVNPPRDSTDGVQVDIIEPGKARDEGLRNGRMYHYLICCVYRRDDGTVAVSPGVRHEAGPGLLPEIAENFTVDGQGQTIVCTWSPPAYGQAMIRRLERTHELKKGERLSADKVYQMGEEIAVSGPNQAIDFHPDIHTPYYSVFTIAGSHAIAGETIAGGICPDVTDLQLSSTRDGVTLRWEWPLGCNAVRVARRADTWPEGPHDLHAKTVPYTQKEYTFAGEKFIDIIQAGRGKYHYIVYAQATPIAASNVFFSPATDPGCRGVITWERGMTLRYRLSTADKKSSRRKELHLTWSTENPLPDFEGFVLVANQDRVPLTADDGVELFRWEPERNQAEGEYEEWVSLKPIQRKKWNSFYCKAILLEPDQHDTVLIIHPNTCIPISKTGKMYLPKKDNTVPHYTAGVPKTVICSRCFEEFPVSRMLFTSYDGVNQVSRTVRYTRIHRLLHRPLRSPKTKHGKLTRKLCPKCKKDLPRTAGTQSNLVIGLVGAKFSGKSHYIASLIQRLKNPVCSDDLPAALLPASDDTQERYHKEFYENLFKNHLELPVTVGTPEPLIYDFSLDGTLWDEERNREVTLSLYETAGENLDKAERIRQMVSYLRVASGIIFLLDPLQVEKTRDILQSSNVSLPDKDLMADPNVFIGCVLRELEHGKVISEAGTLATPVAVVLTKCDVLRDAGLLETNRLWHTEKRHINYFDSEAHADMTGMMGEYVQQWMPEVYQTVRQRFSNYAFFGVSATGIAPDKTTRRYKYISPWRVEDPVLWLLAELKVIPTR